LFVVAQLIPYGRDHTNPPVVATPVWDSARTETLANVACNDCHSNLTTWPWYTNVAPASWLVYNDVEGGREHLNFSEWQRPQDADLAEVLEVIRSGEMPPVQYRLIHAEARLTDAEKAQLATGLEKTWTSSPPGG
jgi:mono/diheme cytochrome c family protein